MKEVNLVDYGTCLLAIHVSFAQMRELLIEKSLLKTHGELGHDTTYPLHQSI